MHMGVGLTNAGVISTVKPMNATVTETLVADVSVSPLVAIKFYQIMNLLL